MAPIDPHRRRREMRDKWRRCSLAMKQPKQAASFCCRGGRLARGGFEFDELQDWCDVRATGQQKKIYKEYGI